MRFTSGVSDSVQILSAVTESCEQVLKQLAGEPCHLACAFASPIYRAHWTEALQLLHEKLSPAVLIGCSGSGVIGGEREFEWVPALSIVAAHLPDVRLYPFAVSPEELERSSPGGFWVDKVGAAPDAQPVFILLVDPYTCEPSKLLAELNATYPKRPIIGGLASGGNEAGEHLLFFDTDILRDGAVGLAMTGNIAMDAIISQGCRPIGRPMIITKAEGSIVWELGGKPALTILQAVLAQLSPADRALAQQAIFVGLAMNEMTASFQAGDFLIRQLAGIDPPSGAIAVTEEVQVGQTLQFHLRDPGTSREDLRRLLTQHGPQVHAPPAGALLFDCLGRGKSFYGVSHHDVKTIRTFNKNLPVGGFFCNGEIGPVGGTNFLHGYTASLGLFRPHP